jgi:serine/threonine-protein kinase SRPK3
MSLSDSDISECNSSLEFKTIKNRYLILNKLGKGGYATVYLAYDVVDNKYYAIKISSDEHDYNVCINETKAFQLLKTIKNPNIIDMICSFDYESEGNKYCCIVFELMGYSLGSFIKEHGAIHPDILMLYTKQILSALNILHKNNITHGDVTPENILLNLLPKKMESMMKDLDIKKRIENYVKKINITCAQTNKKVSLSQKQTKKTLLVNDIDVLFLQKNKNILIEMMSEIGQIVRKYYSLMQVDNNTDTLSYESENSVDSDNETISNLCSLSSQYDSYNDSESDSENEEITQNNNVDDINEIERLKSAIVKLSDMGNCIINGVKKKKRAQTCYYMSPEILLRLDHGWECDMWALGCTIYELLTNKLLFDIDNYDKYNGNIDRLHLYLITKTIGEIPTELIRASKYRDIFYTNDMKNIKGIKHIEGENHNIYNFSQKNNFFLHLLPMLLKTNPRERISAEKILVSINELCTTANAN